MKRIAVVLAVLALATVAFAQDASKAEVFGGYQFLSLDGKASLNASGGRDSLHGFNADVAFKAHKNVSLVGDFGFSFKSTSFDTGTEILDVKTRMYPILFGPRFTAPSGKWTPFAEALIGISHGSFGASGVTMSENDFAMALGGGLDVKVANKVSVRLGKFDYLFVKGAGKMFDVIGIGTMRENLNNLRFSTGLVFQF
jgi:opacity protein-like surface antigen